MKLHIKKLSHIDTDAKWQWSKDIYTYFAVFLISVSAGK